MTDVRQPGKWMGRGLKDMRGQEFKVGDYVAKAYQSGRSCNLQVGRVTKIDEEKGKLYLDNSKVAVWYPGRTLIVTQVFAGETAENP